MNITAADNAFADLGLSAQPSNSDRTELGQDAFLKLMTTQLQNQDPFKPMDNGEFLGQIAQFSTVSGIQGMQESLAGLSASLTSNQSLQAAGLVGHGVLIPSDTAILFDEADLTGAVDVPFAGDVTVEVTDAAGQVVGRIALGEQPAGMATFSWDGIGANGERLPAGQYGIRASHDAGGASTSLNTLSLGLVNSVSLGAGGVTLNLLGMESTPLSNVREIL